jgi:hypothetical protein
MFDVLIGHVVVTLTDSVQMRIVDCSGREREREFCLC